MGSKKSEPGSGAAHKNGSNGLGVQVWIAGARALVESKVFQAIPEDLSAVTASLVYKVVDAVEKAADARRKVLRDQLLSYAKANGTKDKEKGHYRAEAGDFKVTAECRKASTPDGDGLKALLEEKGLKVSEAFDEVKTLVANPSKIQFLVDTGKLSAEKVGALYATSFALKVTEPKELKEELASLKPASLEG